MSKAGRNKSGSQQHCILLKSTSSRSRLQVATSVNLKLLTRVVAKATSKAAQRSFRGQAQDAFESSSLFTALNRVLDDTHQELAREVRLENATEHPLRKSRRGSRTVPSHHHPRLVRGTAPPPSRTPKVERERGEKLQDRHQHEGAPRDHRHVFRSHRGCHQRCTRRACTFQR